MPKSKYSEGLEGTRFNRTVIVSFSHFVRTKEEVRWYWRCLCDCGTTHVADARSMFRGFIESCGCLGKEKLELRTKHGYAPRSNRSPEHFSFHKMKERVDNPSNEWFHRYGGRGIRYCQGMGTFTHFIQILGPRPKGRTIDHKNNDGHYSCGECPECLSNNWPLNVRWATVDEQNGNKHNTLFLTVGNKKQPLFIWAKQIGVTRHFLYERYRKSPSDAVNYVSDALAAVNLYKPGLPGSPGLVGGGCPPPGGSPSDG